MNPVLEIVPHVTGSWLIKVGLHSYAVPPPLGRALQPLAGSRPTGRELRACLTGARGGALHDFPAPDIDTWVGELNRVLAPETAPKRGLAGGRQAGRSLRFRVPLVPAAAVGYLAGNLRVLTGDRCLAFMMLLGGAFYVRAGYLAAEATSGPVGFFWDLRNVIAGLGLFLLSAFWHELGHAAALARAGYPPGGIGAGILFVIPVLFADVTAMGALPRTGRIRVDLSGMTFQLAAGGTFLALASWPAFPPAMVQALVLAGSSALVAITWSLFPFLRSDGYWLLCDLLGLDDLDRPPASPVSLGLRVFLVGYQVTNALFLLLIGVYFPWRMIGLLLALAKRLGFSPDSFPAPWLAVAAGLLFVGVMGIGLARKAVALFRSAAVVARG